MKPDAIDRGQPSVALPTDHPSREEYREFLMVVRQALLLIVRFIERKYLG